MTSELKGSCIELMTNAGLVTIPSVAITINDAEILSLQHRPHSDGYVFVPTDGMSGTSTLRLFLIFVTIQRQSSAPVKCNIIFFTLKNCSNHFV